MKAFWIRLPVLLTFARVVLAKTAEYIDQELSAAGKTMQQLQCSVDTFKHCSGGYHRCRDIKPLFQIYQINSELDDELRVLIEDIQTSSDFSFKDSELLTLAFNDAREPIRDTLESFKNKHSEFGTAIGPILRHRIIGGSIRQTRCLTMDLLRSLECRSDDAFKEFLSASQVEIDSMFQEVLRLY